VPLLKTTFEKRIDMQFDIGTVSELAMKRRVLYVLLLINV